MFLLKTCLNSERIEHRRKLRDISSTSISQLGDQIAQGTLKLPSARVWTQENTGINIEESKYYKIDSLVFNEAVKNFEKNIIIRQSDNLTGALITQKQNSHDLKTILLPV